MSRIFISYSRKDEFFARRLALSLADAGVDVWIDLEDIPGGMKWSTAVQEGLNTSQVLIVILSPDSMTSRNVEDEWQYFLDKGKPVLPILWRPTEIHFQLHRLQRIDFYKLPYDVGLKKLFVELYKRGIRDLNVPELEAWMEEDPTHVTRPPELQKQQPRRWRPLLFLPVAACVLVTIPAMIALPRLLPSTVTSTPTFEVSTSSPQSPTETTTPEAPTSTPTPMLPLAVANEPVNVREGGNRNTEIIGVLQRHQSAIVLGRNRRSDWWYIEFVDTKDNVTKRGWVSAPFVDIDGDTSNLPVINS